MRDCPELSRRLTPKGEHSKMADGPRAMEVAARGKEAWGGEGGGGG